jgi:hypothetical protein
MSVLIAALVLYILNAVVLPCAFVMTLCDSSCAVCDACLTGGACSSDHVHSCSASSTSSPASPCCSTRSIHACHANLIRQ